MARRHDTRLDHPGLPKICARESPAFSAMTSGTTHLLNAGVDVRTVVGRLEHRNPSTTLNVYSHFLPESDQDTADVLGPIFDDA